MSLFTTSTLLGYEVAESYTAEPLPETETIQLEPLAALGEGPARENSGIVKSRHHENVYWMLNDSGDEPRIYPITRNGEVWGAQRYEDVSGVLIGGAINVDWEDIAVDASGNVLIADVGNNCNCRQDLVIYVVPEPRPEAGRAPLLKKLFFRYPDQFEFPAPSFDYNYDCEGIFTIEDDIFILTKNRSDSFVKLYSLRDPVTDKINVLTYLGQFDVHGKSTASDATPDGLQLVITTYDYIWHFERESLDQSFFSGAISVMKYEAPQVEAICFMDSESLLLACEESANLYEVNLGQFRPYQPNRDW